MKRFRLAILLAIGLAITAFTIWWRIPFTYAAASLNPYALHDVKWAQRHDPRPHTPEECATKYLFYRTDYEKEIPKRIKVSSKELRDGTWRVSVYDPGCEDDSTYEIIQRVYLTKTSEGHWQPVRVEWVHKARGRWGWTTEPGA